MDAYTFPKAPAAYKSPGRFSEKMACSISVQHEAEISTLKDKTILWPGLAISSLLYLSLFLLATFEEVQFLEIAS